MIIRFIWIFLVLICYNQNILSQSFGGNKWSQKWYQINVDNAKVIYPEGFESRAKRVLDIIHHIQNNHRQTIGLQTDKISLVLNNQTNISNGYVGLAPFRSEFFTTPFQNNFALGSLPWLDLLTIHEYRHVLQYSNGKKGISKLLSVLFGQSALAGALNVTLPDWYFEGDAVLSETVHTPQGRGRIPHFLRGFKAYESENKRFRYDKVRNGSYKDFIPDHYRSGYMINKYAAEQYGPDFWPGVLGDAGAFKGLFYPFSRAIESRTQLTSKNLYEKTFGYYRLNWTNDESSRERRSNETIISEEPNVFTNYRFPHQISNEHIVYIRSSFNETAAVYEYKDGREKKLFSLGVNTENYIDTDANLIAWTELRFHPTRGNIDYSVLMTYDLNKSLKSQISYGTRYFSPAVHPEGKIIATVSIDELGSTNVEIVSSRDGSKIKSLTNDLEYFITYPEWSTDGSAIYFAARDANGQMAICRQNFENSEVNVLTSWSYSPIGAPHATSKYVYFSQSSDDAEHIFRVDIQTNKVEQITSRPFGTYYPHVSDDSEIIYSEYTSNGLRLKKQSIKPLTIESAEKNIAEYRLTGYGENILNTVQPVSVSPKKYGNLSNPINFHSWGVTADDTNAAILIESDNILNSVSIFGGYQYLFEDERSIWTAGARLGFIYPYLEARYSLESRSALLQNQNNETIKVNFNEHTLRLGADFPINLSSGVYLRSFIPQYDIEKIFLRGPLINDLDINSHEIGFAFFNRRIKAHREIMAKFSQFVLIQFRNSLDDLEAKQVNVETELTLPGILPNHILRVEMDYKSEPGLNDYRFSNRFDFARGYGSVVSDKTFRLGLNYHLPLLYPEFGIAGIAYLKRIQANVFYDLNRVTFESQDIDLKSYGAEFIFDTQFFNTLPVSLGLRYSRGIDDDFNVFEFFIPFYRL